MPEEISDQPAGGIAGDGGGDLNSIAKARESRPFGGRGGREGGGGGIEMIGAAMVFCAEIAASALDRHKARGAVALS